MTSKKDLSEQDICSKYITPAILAAKWDLHTQIREQVYITAGRVQVRGKLATRGKRMFADYILYQDATPLAVIEAKENKLAVGAGMQQALTYAEMLGVPYVYASNGDAFLAHDRTGQANPVEEEIALEAFPGPPTLWRGYCTWKGIAQKEEAIVTQPYHTDASGKAPRYYQVNAINSVVEAAARGQNRILLVMATGTGKTYTAFQIIWRLWQAGVKKRILFLADRNILVDQTRTNDFKPFAGAMTKITHRKVDKSYEIYLALYQAISGPEHDQDIFKQFSPDFFDLIIVDECHRGSASENSAWRDVLDYFTSATQLGMTATPKETTDVSTRNYFGDPVYTYSLKQGIEDGFLAPYKVVRVDLDKDLAGWRPPRGKRDKHGEEIEDRIYSQKDFDRLLVLEKRTALVAKKVTEFLKETDRFAKTIVFCEDIHHAERMRQALVNENADLCAENRKYVMRITGDETEGKAELYNFTHPDERYPVIVTTSKLLSTGVDVKTCKVIVLDQNISSMTEFKQIIGRGTRIEEDYGKLFFTIVDFRKATELFADPDFDGDPAVIYVPKEGEPIAPPDDVPDAAPTDPMLPPGVAGVTGGPITSEPRRKYVVADVPVFVVAERVQYMDKQGKLVTETLRDYARKTIRAEYVSLDGFLKKWSAADRKTAVVEELQEHGVFFEELASEIGRDYSPFDLVCHIAFDQKPLTRKERANNVRKGSYFTKYGAVARRVLDALLEKYAEEGVDDIEDVGVLNVRPIAQIGTVKEIIADFGGRDAYVKAVRDLEAALYGRAS